MNGNVPSTHVTRGQYAFLRTVHDDVAGRVGPSVKLDVQIVGLVFDQMLFLERDRGIDRLEVPHLPLECLQLANPFGEAGLLLGGTQALNCRRASSSSR